MRLLFLRQLPLRLSMLCVRMTHRIRIEKDTWDVKPTCGSNAAGIMAQNTWHAQASARADAQAERSQFCDPRGRHRWRASVERHSQSWRFVAGRVCRMVYGESIVVYYNLNYGSSLAQSRANRALLPAINVTYTRWNVYKREVYCCLRCVRSDKDAVSPRNRRHCCVDVARWWWWRGEYYLPRIGVVAEAHRGQIVCLCVCRLGGGFIIWKYRDFVTPSLLAVHCYADVCNVLSAKHAQITREVETSVDLCGYASVFA